jgi:hypothetical protein
LDCIGTADKEKHRHGANADGLMELQEELA